MIVSIHQPQYLPWPGYFEKIDRADVFVFLDDVQFTKNDWQNRNKLRTPEGWQWLTVPVKHHHGQKINETEVDVRSAWARKHLRSLEVNYSRAPFFAGILSELRPVYETFLESTGMNAQKLSDACLAFIRTLLRLLYGADWTLIDPKMNPPSAVGSSRAGLVVTKSSLMNLPQEPTARLVSICKQLGADTYYSGAHGRHYLEMTQFEKEQIRVVFQDFREPEYAQCFEPFVPNLSVVDLLFNVGPKAMDLIRSGGRPA